jgi:hypothetical protein
MDNMEILLFWLENDPTNRKFSFFHTETYEGAWLCTLIIHEDDEAHSYTAATTQFVGSPFNTKQRCTDIAVSMFVVDVCSGKLQICYNKHQLLISSTPPNTGVPPVNLKRRNCKKRNRKNNTTLRKRLFSDESVNNTTL